LRWAIRVAFTVALFILIFNPQVFGIRVSFIPVTLRGLWDEIRNLDPDRFWRWILFGLAIKSVAVLSNMGKWDLLLRGQGIRLSFPYLAGTFLIGRFFGTFLPGTIGLDGYRLYDVARETGKAIESTTVILVDKLIGFVALTFLVLVTFPLGLRILHLQARLHLGTLAPVMALLVILIAGGLVLLMKPELIRSLIHKAPIPFRARFEGQIQHVAQAATAYSGQGPLIIRAVGYGIMSHFCTSLMYFGTAMAVQSFNASILDILFVSPIMIYGTVLGPSIGGEGIREFVFIYLMGASVGPAKAFLISHLGFWLEEVFALLGGLIFLFRPAGRQPHLTIPERRSLVHQATKNATLEEDRS